jgi:AcrR family transcriptional regulator
LEETRKALIRAASEVIGEFGYDGASIGRITERAGLAQGTFYLYFDSRQAADAGLFVGSLQLI